MLALASVLLSCGGATANDLAVATRQYRKENFDAALKALDRFDKTATPTGESLDLRGCIYLEQQKFDDARKAFGDAHQASPNTFAPRLHEGDAFLRQKKFPEAREIYQGLLGETNVLVGNERLRFGVLLTYLGEHDELNAQKAFAAITFPTETPTYYYAQAAWEFAHHKKSEAQDWIDKARKVFDPEAPLWLAQHLYHFGWLKNKPPLPKKHE